LSTGYTACVGAGWTIVTFRLILRQKTCSNSCDQTINQIETTGKVVNSRENSRNHEYTSFLGLNSQHNRKRTDNYNPSLALICLEHSKNTASTGEDRCKDYNSR
jgi:hypothetical protein